MVYTIQLDYLQGIQMVLYNHRQAYQVILEKLTLNILNNLQQ